MCNAFVRHDLSRREGRGEKHYRIARADKSRPQPRTRLAWESKISRLLGIYALVRGNENVFASSFFDKEGEEKKRKEEEESVSGSLYNGDLAACLFVHLFIARRSSPFGVHGYAEIR